MRRNHSIIACSRHIFTIGVVLRAHSVRGESHIQCNAKQEVATVQSDLLYCNPPALKVLNLHAKQTHTVS